MYMFSGKLRCEHLETPTQDTELPEHMLAERSLQEVSMGVFVRMCGEISVFSVWVHVEMYMFSGRDLSIWRH